jgi:hypothetical protein
MSYRNEVHPYRFRPLRRLQNRLGELFDEKRNAICLFGNSIEKIFGEIFLSRQPFDNQRAVPSLQSIEDNRCDMRTTNP